MDAITPAIESNHNKISNAESSTGEPMSGRRTEARRKGENRRTVADKAELAKLRAAGGDLGKKNPAGAKQKCYSWNNGSSPCGDLQPRQALRGESAKRTSLHDLRLPRSPFEILSNKKKS